MELELIRTYYPAATNGRIFYQDRLMMYSIELPWKDNHTRVSCIPEGKYELVKRWSPKFDQHLLLMNVPNRNSIFIHPANDAMHELKGCIANVCFLTGAGKGIRPRPALKTLMGLGRSCETRLRIRFCGRSDLTGCLIAPSVKNIRHLSDGTIIESMQYFINSFRDGLGIDCGRQ